jgi:curved DNA-binding protein CbpA
MRPPSSDPFALLGIPRRPVVDLDLLEKNVRSLASKHHPDHVTGDTSTFEKIQEAATLLRHPTSRLRFLAREATAEKNTPTIAKELFSTVATALSQAEEKITAYHAASGVLAKALLTKDLLKARTTLITAQQSLQQWQELLSRQLQEFDTTWPEVTSSELLTLASSFLFAQRWEKQLQEALFQSDIMC